MRRAITASLVHGPDGFLDDHAVVIEDEHIADVRPRSEVDPAVPVEDWGDVAVVPGTVNAHGHAFQSLFKGFADDRDSLSWRNDVMYPFAETLTGEDIYWGAVFAFAEAALAGVTTTVDFFYLHDQGNANAEQVIRAARDVGVRLVLARTFYDDTAKNTAPARFREKPEAAEKRLRELAAQHQGESGVVIQPAPHSLRAASLDTVARALAVAEDLDATCHLHIHERPDARADLVKRLGATPVRLLHKAGLITPRLLVVHGVWLEQDEIDLLAQGGASLVHCPATSMTFGHPAPPIVSIMERGMTVALGFDGGCGNNRQSIFDEMRTASLEAKQLARDPRVLDAHTAFSMGTQAGADVLGLAAGRLEAGRYADMVALDLTDLSLQPRKTLAYQIAHSLQATAIRKVMTAGRLTVDDGRLTGISQEELVAAVNRVAGRWPVPVRH
ncbi:amidohydrolase family protein [Saccharopolyspora phatthalungensis]|uniref:5-methylthioadenosine/S-adenosylhomocysteine deaminase n=1 Tax=Saccharopolyspora phatthalungensis TaxID=664693 RepID=A0A840QKA7_9PSEU|nr:amidohydrolase family protein [Saccharopolyspora phatthalungensis]MBB5159869.1 5-methylthioadenosine/S-adenosylhomocysteine deaminase [Saccharopolyspora phatthalungensis]